MITSDATSLARSLSCWEYGEYLSCAFVALACAGEYVADFTNWLTGESEERKKKLAKRSTLLLIVSLAAELVCLVQTNSLSGRLIGSLSERAGAAEAEAQSAETSAREAKQRVEEVAREADTIASRLAVASEHLKELEHTTLVQGPRWRPLGNKKEEFVKSVKPFAGQKILVVYCGRWATLEPEPYRVGQDLMNFLGKQGADWQINGATWDTCGPGGATSVGGNLVMTSVVAGVTVKKAATALYDVLNKLEINTIKLESAPDDANPNSTINRALGPGSPWELSAKDPTSVILLVGANPMFNLSGWKKHHK